MQPQNRGRNKWEKRLESNSAKSFPPYPIRGRRLSLALPPCVSNAYLDLTTFSSFPSGDESNRNSTTQSSKLSTFQKEFSITRATLRKAFAYSAIESARDPSISSISKLPLPLFIASLPPQFSKNNCTPLKSVRFSKPPIKS